MPHEGVNHHTVLIKAPFAKQIGQVVTKALGSRVTKSPRFHARTTQTNMAAFNKCDKEREREREREAETETEKEKKKVC